MKRGIPGAVLNIKTLPATLSCRGHRHPRLSCVGPRWSLAVSSLVAGVTKAKGARLQFRASRVMYARSTFARLTFTRHSGLELNFGFLKFAISLPESSR